MAAHEELVEKVARALSDNMGGYFYAMYHARDDDAQAVLKVAARAAIAVMPELAALVAERDALAGRERVLLRFVERLATQVSAEKARADHEDEGHDGEPDFEGAYDHIINDANETLRARAALAQEPR